MSNTVTTEKNTSKKAKALLAGGLVLGVGAVVTLAAWTDQEWATGDFKAGSFNVESSADGTNFKNHPDDEGAAELKFDMSSADNLSPAETIAAPFVLRLDDKTTYNAKVSLEHTELTSGDATGLTYGITQVNSLAACHDDTEVGITSIVPKGTPLGQKPINSEKFSLAHGDEGQAGKEAILCFQITADEALTQSQEATATWAFDAVSQ